MARRYLIGIDLGTTTAKCAVYDTGGAVVAEATQDMEIRYPAPGPAEQDALDFYTVACALIRPEKKLEPVETDFAVKRMKEKRFAAGASRERIRACEELGLSVEEFMEIALKAMKEIHVELGL